MSESLHIPTHVDKNQQYLSLIPQIESLISSETNLIANLANTTAALQQAFSFLWTGFYLVENGGLILGPFQGPIACTRIGYGKGVCGTAFANKETIIVEDVDKFPGHIACSSDSRSEIVVPVIKGEEVKMILDIDSEHVAHFDQTDQLHLEKLASIIAKIHFA